MDINQHSLFPELEPDFDYKKIENLTQVFHPWDKWEDYPAGFYENISGRNKKEMIQNVVYFFSDSLLTEKYMNEVVVNWNYSCEHNFTNPSINKVAYLGQSAVCMHLGIPSLITMEAWSLVDINHRKKANEIAEKYINKWFKNYLACKR